MSFIRSTANYGRCLAGEKVYNIVGNLLYTYFLWLLDTYIMHSIIYIYEHGKNLASEKKNSKNLKTCTLRIVKQKN